MQIVNKIIETLRNFAQKMRQPFFGDLVIHSSKLIFQIKNLLFFRK